MRTGPGGAAPAEAHPSRATVARAGQEPANSCSQPIRGLAYWDTPRAFTLWQRIQIALFSRAGAWIIRWLGSTLRWESEGGEPLEQVHKEGRSAILVCWHCCTFASTYYWRQRGIVVMSSQNFESECLAGALRRLGYGLARGSSSRGGLKALAEMARYLRSGKDAGFTVDGPRGPRFEAKPGPMLLAKRTGNPVLCFHVSLQRKIQLKTWDRTQIPLPFSKAFILKAPPIYLTKDASEAQLKSGIATMQSTLEELRGRAEARWN